MIPTIAANAERSRLPQMFELVCADVHPVSCDEVVRSATPEELVARTREHGVRAHGFTPAWYTPGRLTAMAQAVNAR